MCERLRESLALAINQGGAPNFTASYGIAPWHEGSTMEELVAEADTALYQAKRDGRNRNVVYRPASASATVSETSRP